MPRKKQEAAQAVEEVTVRNGGTAIDTEVSAGTELENRVGIAEGTPRIPKELIERQMAQLEAFAEELKQRTDEYVRKAMEDARSKPGEVNMEIAEPIGPTRPLYPWWDVYVVGPFQPIGYPPHGPFLPHKIVQPGYVFLWAVIWRNPAPIDWIYGNPSAAQIMNGRRYMLNCELLNLSTVTNGPDVHVAGAFTVGGYIDFHLLVVRLPRPPQGRPHLYECNVTVDTSEDAQPMAAFATWVYDLDREPAFLHRPYVRQHWHHEQPMRFLVYRP